MFAKSESLACYDVESVAFQKLTIVKVMLRLVIAMEKLHIGIYICTAYILPEHCV